MRSFHLFRELLADSCKQIFQEKDFFWKCFLALVLLDNLEIINVLFKTKEEGGTQIALMFLSMMAVLVVIAQIVLREKKKSGQHEELIYFLITFLLYNLYFSFLFFFGLLLFILPGLYVLIHFYLVPFVAVLDDNNESSHHYFKKARRLAKGDLPLVAWVASASLFTDALSLIGSAIGDPTTKMVFNFGFSFIESFLALVMTLTSLKLYRHLTTLSATATNNPQPGTRPSLEV